MVGDNTVAATRVKSFETDIFVQKDTALFRSYLYSREIDLTL